MQGISQDAVTISRTPPRKITCRTALRSGKSGYRLQALHSRRTMWKHTCNPVWRLQRRQKEISCVDGEGEKVAGQQGSSPASPCLRIQAQPRKILPVLWQPCGLYSSGGSDGNLDFSLGGRRAIKSTSLAIR